MYVAKRGGRGRAIYAADADPHTARRLSLVAGLRHAIEHGQLFLEYQPKISMRGNNGHQVEALVRWMHPEFGLIPPEQFIPLAENIGLIKPLTAWVLDAAIRQTRVWQDGGKAVSVAVNLSAWNLQDPDLVETVKSLLKRWKVSPYQLQVEVTESSLMVDQVRALQLLLSLHELGVRISIDDFGTGYSSLAYLGKLPVDEIKIDRSFISDIADGRDEPLILVRSIVELGHNLGMEVVAEGIETQDNLHALGDVGCDWTQGHFLSRPLSATDYERWLESISDPNPIARPA
jgi:EAL domain-containing protein (putative c-di-GMP-specific phosphodiesterase class I)